MEALLITCCVLAAAALIGWLYQRNQRVRAVDRLSSASLTTGTYSRNGALEGVPDGSVARWLFLAGDRRPGAHVRFWQRTALLAVLGLAVGITLQFSGALIPLRANLEQIPGRIGYLFVPVVSLLPALAVFVFAALPTVRVRRARRARTRLILGDLYPVLELFASLAQAGLAFDAALARVLSTIGGQRPLGRELMTFQAEVLSGADRSQCFRRLARRVELPQVTSFTAALIRAHEVGIGLAATLRRQADELRGELRERALAHAQSLPARLVIPLVLCFLPGIFVMSLGPAFYGFLMGTAGFGTTR